MAKLTGNEVWLADRSIVYGRMWGDKEQWWPITCIDLDTGLIKLDVCGLLQNAHLSDLAQIRTDHGIIDNEDFYNEN